MRQREVTDVIFAVPIDSIRIDEKSRDAILACYRLRWQVELTFKRFKSLAALGDLRKHDEDRTQAWLYCKLFMALVAEKLMRHARAISPLGFDFRSRELA